ncbi:MAG: NADH:ubiquinone oxidoreductase, subunit RnfA [Oscillospiraceae bacterium]|nr:NADH:ubiquinone oxidoreductase, subunit RnfA [Oscillospiraceae bacterium]
MMQFLFDFFIAAVAAVFIENTIFTRGLGASRMLMAVKTPRTMFKFSIMLTSITTLSGLLGWGVNLLIRKSPIRLYIEPLVFVIVLIAVYVIYSVVLYFVLPQSYRKMSEILLLAVFNCAALGAILLPAHNSVISAEVSLASWLGFSFGTGVAFFLATVLVFEGTRKLRGTQVPAAFRGLPATLIYIGILSLAFYGLIGHELPF